MAAGSGAAGTATATAGSGGAVSTFPTDQFVSFVSHAYHGLLHVFRYLTVQELMAAAGVCKLWRELALHHSHVSLWFLFLLFCCQICVQEKRPGSMFKPWLYLLPSTSSTFIYYYTLLLPSTTTLYFYTLLLHSTTTLYHFYLLLHSTISIYYYIILLLLSNTTTIYYFYLLLLLSKTTTLYYFYFYLMLLLIYNFFTRKTIWIHVEALELG